MFKIVKDGDTIAFVESLHFIRLHENGCFVQTDEETAQGVAVNGTPYNLTWRKPMNGVEDFVTYSEIDSGEYIAEQQSAIDGIITSTLDGGTENGLEKQVRKLYQTDKLDIDGVVNAISNKWLTPAGAIDFIGEDKSVEIIRRCLLRELSKACNDTITAGIGVVLGGETLHFSLTANDQINLSGAVKAVEGGAKAFPYHNDGGLCRLYSADEITAISDAATQFILYHTTYCNHLNVWVRRAKDEDELNAIYYGVALPDDLADNMNKVMSTEGA